MARTSDASSSRTRRILAALSIAFFVTLTIGLAPPLWLPVRLLDDTIYDGLYYGRTPVSQKESSVVIVDIDDDSLNAMDNWKKVHWPWPRTYWADLLKYLDQAGAKVVVFDLLFNGSGVAPKPGEESEDDIFAAAIDRARVPVVFSADAPADRTKPKFEIYPGRDPILGAANVSPDPIVRTYVPVVYDVPSVATQVVKSVGAVAPSWAMQPFRLQIYGPHVRNDKRATFKFIPVAHVLNAARNLDEGVKAGVTPELFRNKIVMIGATGKALFDMKAAPLSPKFPGVEGQATAVLNMLNDQHVVVVPLAQRVMFTFIAAMLGALATILPQRTGLKLVAGLIGPAMILGIAVFLFRQSTIHWLPAAAPLAASFAAIPLAFSYSYVTELRLRRFALKALSQYLSKRVVDQLTNEQLKLALGGQRRTMTVMFSDLANFTSYSETLGVDGLTSFLNYYLEEMSNNVLENDGTIDKYIGDAIMSFWNAPLDQADHAKRSCMTALKMMHREIELQSEMRARAGTAVLSRIGINTGSMLVGNLGSAKKFNYTVIGDSVNLASRLEGANKMYGTRILMAETTAMAVRDSFVMRKVDRLRVKGKAEPIDIYQLIGHLPGEAATLSMIRHYEEALEQYQAKQFESAQSILLELRREFPQDGPTVTLLHRVELFLKTPPPEDWDGVFVAYDK